jgi:hypothetical protein
MSDTPRTDSAIRNSGGQWSYVLRYTCEQLERELADAREQCCQAINDYETALRNIMQNEKAMHRMDYNPYLIASAALKGGQNE